MHIISFIEELDIIEKILRHLGLWDIRNHDPPQPVTSDYIPDLLYDFSEFLPFRVFPNPGSRLLELIFFECFAGFPVRSVQNQPKR